MKSNSSFLKADPLTGPLGHGLRQHPRTVSGMCGYICGSEKPVRSELRQTAAITDFVGQRAPHVFLTQVPVVLPFVGPIKALGSFVTSVNPQDGFCESLAD